MKLVGYARVSSQSQKNNTSLTTQEQAIKNYCEYSDQELIGMYSEVASGKEAKSRRQYQAAIAALKDADGLIATAVDRITRSSEDFSILLNDILLPGKKELIIINLSTLTSDKHSFDCTVLSTLAEIEAKLINERTQGGRKAKAATGGYAYGSPKFGESAKDGELVANPQELEVIEIIRRHHKSGKSLRAIAQYLNDHGYPAKHRGTWGATSVKRVIDRLHPKKAKLVKQQRG